jgi:hypothetical protein
MTFVCSIEPYARVIPAQAGIQSGGPLDHPVKPYDDDTTTPARDTLIPSRKGISQGILKQVQHDNTGRPTLIQWVLGYSFFSDLLDII